MGLSLASMQEQAEPTDLDAADAEDESEEPELTGVGHRRRPYPVPLHTLGVQEPVEMDTDELMWLNGEKVLRIRESRPEDVVEVSSRIGEKQFPTRVPSSAADVDPVIGERPENIQWALLPQSSSRRAPKDKIRASEQAVYNARQMAAAVAAQGGME